RKLWNKNAAKLNLDRTTVGNPPRVSNRLRVGVCPPCNDVCRVGYMQLKIFQTHPIGIREECTRSYTQQNLMGILVIVLKVMPVTRDYAGNRKLFRKSFEPFVNSGLYVPCRGTIG